MNVIELPVPRATDLPAWTDPPARMARSLVTQYWRRSHLLPRSAARPPAIAVFDDAIVQALAGLKQHLAHAPEVLPACRGGHRRRGGRNPCTRRRASSRSPAWRCCSCSSAARAPNWRTWAANTCRPSRARSATPCASPSMARWATTSLPGWRCWPGSRGGALPARPPAAAAGDRPARRVGCLRGSGRALGRVPARRHGRALRVALHRPRRRGPGPGRRGARRRRRSRAGGAGTHGQRARDTGRARRAGAHPRVARGAGAAGRARGLRTRGRPAGGAPSGHALGPPVPGRFPGRRRAAAAPSRRPRAVGRRGGLPRAGRCRGPCSRARRPTGSSTSRCPRRTGPPPPMRYWPRCRWKGRRCAWAAPAARSRWKIPPPWWARPCATCSISNMHRALRARSGSKPTT